MSKENKFEKMPPEFVKLFNRYVDEVVHFGNRRRKECLRLLKVILRKLEMTFRSKNPGRFLFLKNSSESIDLELTPDCILIKSHECMK